MLISLFILEIFTRILFVFIPKRLFDYWGISLVSIQFHKLMLTHFVFITISNRFFLFINNLNQMFDFAEVFSRSSFWRKLCSSFTVLLDLRIKRKRRGSKQNVIHKILQQISHTSTYQVNLALYLLFFVFMPSNIVFYEECRIIFEQISSKKVSL